MLPIDRPYESAPGGGGCGVGNHTDSPVNRPCEKGGRAGNHTVTHQSTDPVKGGTGGGRGFRQSHTDSPVKRPCERGE